jgi:hypothetical protein
MLVAQLLHGSGFETNLWLKLCNVTVNEFLKTTINDLNLSNLYIWQLKNIAIKI